MLSLMGTFVLADEDNVALASAEAGLSTAEMATATADENVESSSGILSDKFKMVFANKGKKSEIRMDIANKRMNELKRAENNPDKAKKIAKKYESELGNALESFDQIAIDGDKEQVIKALKQTVIMKYRLETHGEKISEVHAGILTRKSEEMNAEQIAHLTDVFGNINDKVSSKLTQIEERQNNLISRAVVLGLSEEEVRAKLESFEASLDKKRQIRDGQFKERIEAKLESNGELREKFELKTKKFKEKIEVRREKSDGSEVIALN